jgi:hypothetical protein
MAEKALAARERGESLDTVFAQQREQLEKAKKPRKNVAKNIQQGRLGENDGQQVMQRKGSARPA